MVSEVKQANMAMNAGRVGSEFIVGGGRTSTGAVSGMLCRKDLAVSPYRVV